MEEENQYIKDLLSAIEMQKAGIQAMRRPACENAERGKKEDTRGYKDKPLKKRQRLSAFIDRAKKEAKEKNEYPV